MARSSLSSLLLGAGIGAGLMYYFDPQLGRRRRKLLLDQYHHMMNASCHTVDAMYRDSKNRAYGMYAELKQPFMKHDNSDDVLVQRVRSKMGRHVSHPHAIEVSAHDGRITLRGPILANEVEKFVSAVKSVIGVRSVDNQLDVHEKAGNISALQGGQS